MSTPLSDWTNAELLSLLEPEKSLPDEGLTQKLYQSLTDIQGETGTPHPRQHDFLSLDCEEALYGGAAGGGKTEALEMWLADGVQIPTYSGIFFRRTYPQLSRSNDSPIARSHRLYAPLGGVWRDTEKCWLFPSGARIDFSHMQYENDKYNHQGPSYHRMAFDELTQFTETQYTYLLSRLRKHVGFPIAIGARGASNPDGIGRLWVMKRFITQEAIDSIRELTARDPSPQGQQFTTSAGRVFMPSRVADNPTLDVEDYIERLQTQLSPTLAARLANGDWSVTEGAIIDPEWFRYYTMTGEHLKPMNPDGEIAVIHDKRCRRFATIDTAGTSKHKANEDRGKPPSWSVCAIWDYWQEMKMLFLRHIWRERVDWPGLKRGVNEVLKEWSVPLAIVEAAHWGEVLASELDCQARLSPVKMRGMKTAQVGTPLSAKQERAVSSGFMGMLETGRMFFPDMSTVPDVNMWLPDFEAELLGWTGRAEETADQIDVCSHAAHHVKSRPVRTWDRPLPARTRGATL